MKSYGNIGDKYPMQRGEAYKVGDHLFVCGDLLDDGHYKALKAVESHVMYCDPPWNQAMSTAFKHKAGLSGENPFNLLIEKAVSFAESVFIEMGQAQVGLLSRLIEQRFGTSHKWPITYFGVRPAYLVSNMVTWDFSNLDDAHSPLTVFQKVKPRSVIDPMVGRGLTSTAAIQAGVQSGLYNELHPRRLAHAIHTASQMLNLKPLKLGASEWQRTR